jgi:hypothetical protein
MVYEFKHIIRQPFPGGDPVPRPALSRPAVTGGVVVPALGRLNVGAGRIDESELINLVTQLGWERPGKAS